MCFYCRAHHQYTGTVLGVLLEIELIQKNAYSIDEILIIGHYSISCHEFFWHGEYLQLNRESQVDTNRPVLYINPILCYPRRHFSAHGSATSQSNQIISNIIDMIALPFWCSKCTPTFSTSDLGLRFCSLWLIPSLGGGLPIY